MKTTKRNKRQSTCRLSLHPLFLAVGIFYCLKGELFLFLMSCLIAVQHECAHAFSAARLGYRLNKIVLMPFGAVIDGDMRGLSLKDEIVIAVWGPLCNLFTAAFFAAIWWFTPTMYAFTDTACFSSLSIALVNLLPAYPLDGGRILRCVLTRIFCKNTADYQAAERKSEKWTKGVTLFFATALLMVFILLLFRRTYNFSLLFFAGFLFFGALGNKDKSAIYEKMSVSCKNALRRGVELRRVAVLDSCPVKDAFRFLSRGTYLVLEVYDEQENHLFDLSQNQLDFFFVQAQTPYESLKSIKERVFCEKNTKNRAKMT
jgi:stage IV sporulation protein FB